MTFHFDWNKSQPGSSAAARPQIGIFLMLVVSLMCVGLFFVFFFKAEAKALLNWTVSVSADVFPDPRKSCDACALSCFSSFLLGNN